MSYREAGKKVDEQAAVKVFFTVFNENCQMIYIIGGYITIDENIRKVSRSGVLFVSAYQTN